MYSCRGKKGKAPTGMHLRLEHWLLLPVQWHQSFLLLKKSARGIYDFIEVCLGVWHRAFDPTCSPPAQLATVCCNELNARVSLWLAFSVLTAHCWDLLPHRA